MSRWQAGGSGRNCATNSTRSTGRHTGYRTSRTTPLGARAALPPTLAIEVVSPDDTLAQQRKKCRFYRDNGVEAAWLFDPDARTMEVFEGAIDGAFLRESDVFASTVLAGFELNLGELFDVLTANWPGTNVATGPRRQARSGA